MQSVMKGGEKMIEIIREPFDLRSFIDGEQGGSQGCGCGSGGGNGSGWNDLCINDPDFNGADG